MSRGPFSWRSFTTLILAWTFLTLIISGPILYVSPPGRIANWTQWRIGSLTKAQWQGVHVLTALLFLTGALFHLLKFNWKVFSAYLKKRGDAAMRFGREIALSVALFAIMVAATIANLPPFGTVMTAGEAIKESWDEPAQAPPVPHLEEQTMGAVAARLELQPDAAARLLDKKGIKVPADSGTKLKDVARQNRTSPQAIYAALQPTRAPVRAAAHGEPGPAQGSVSGPLRQRHTNWASHPKRQSAYCQRMI